MANYSMTLDDVFHALANPTRRAIVHRLGKGDATVTELAEPFNMALPSFLKHLRVLERCGLVQSEKEGRVRTCQLDGARLSAADDWISEQQTQWETRLDRLAHYVENNLTKENP